MKTYIAFLRGIMPSKSNMKNEKLKSVFESLGFSNVKSVISSGNIIFEAKSKSVKLLQSQIESELLKELDIKGPAFIRSKEEVEQMINKKPFKNHTHGPKTYLIVSFLKKSPYEIYNVINTNDKKTPDFMKEIEKKYGKDVTTRTWQTIEKVQKKMIKESK